MYATGSVEALNSPYSENLVGFGSAPEGLENNEVVYELLADMGWTAENIDLDQWLRTYCLSRYGYWDEGMQEVWTLLHKSVYSSLYSYPRFTWQTVVPDQRRKSLHDINDDFGKAAELFLGYADKCADSQLYMNDAVEFASLYIAELADRHYEQVLVGVDAQENLAKTVELLKVVDGLLATHPDYSLEKWVDYARLHGADEAKKDRYESNAKRLITTWGGWQEDYAARFWAGLVGDYYIPRIQIYAAEGAEAVDAWEENWIMTPWESTEKPYDNPVETALETIRNNK
jgi:alpha-N-acetylglucosaminidase